MTPKAGRDLDARIAVEVMRWKWQPNAGWYLGTAEMAGCQWSPSTDIAAAWEVVEKLGLRFQLFGPHRKSSVWFAQFILDGFTPLQDQHWKARADTAPLAICLAA